MRAGLFLHPRHDERFAAATIWAFRPGLRILRETELGHSSYWGGEESDVRSISKRPAFAPSFSSPGETT